jgi:hypothetical protein
MGLLIWRVVFDNLLRRNFSPSIIEPRVPDIFGVSAVPLLDPELGFNNVSSATAEQRFVI